MLLVIIGSLLVMLATGTPVAFCFLGLNILGAIVFMGGQVGVAHLITAFQGSLCKFFILPIVLFILMGEVSYQSGIAPRMIDVLDKWVGRVPGRFALLAVAGGILFATMSGASIAGVALLGSLVGPEMEKRGYKKAMSLGPILASGGLAMFIPPSAMAVLLASLAEFSVAKILIAIIIPALLMSAIFAIYITIRCLLQPSLAPPCEVVSAPLSTKLIEFARYILPLGLIIFLVTGVIFLGVATPSEAAATGALGCFALVASYGMLNWDMIKRTMIGTMEVSGMLLLIIMGATAFSQILAYSGVTRGLVELVSSLTVSPIFIIIAMIIVLIIMGTFMDVVAMMMIAVPIFYPVIEALGYDPIWFGVLFLLTVEMGLISPPFGMALFIMKGVSSPDTTMGDVYRAALPFLGLDLLVILLIMAFPQIALWLPELMR